MLSQEGLRRCGSCLCWEAGLAEQRQHNILPGIQALSSNIALMIPKTGSAAEAVSVLRQKEQEGDKGRCHVISTPEHFSQWKVIEPSWTLVLYLMFYTSNNRGLVCKLAGLIINIPLIGARGFFMLS